MLSIITTLTWRKVCSLIVGVLIAKYTIPVILILTTIEFSQVMSAVCLRGWFGANCTYKCNCLSNKCNTNGDCQTGIKCVLGYFGPACQYVDILYTDGSKDNPIALVDNLASSCLNADQQNVSLDFNENHPFYWLRITVRSSVTVNSSTFQLLLNNRACEGMSILAGIQRTWDITCSEVLIVKHIVLNGSIVGSLCSVTVSGGRNVAIKQNTAQSSTLGEYIGFSSDKAVDGNLNTKISNGSCSRTSGDRILEIWSLHFIVPIVLLQIKLHGSTDFRYQLFNFNLTLLDENGNIFETINGPEELKLVYVFYPTQHIVTKTLVVTAQGDSLTICEVETFGEAWCSNKAIYGFACDQPCWCKGNDICHTATGNCVAGCKSGTYGFGCKFNCSSACPDSVCSSRSGHCFTCVIGYYGNFCEKKCDNTHYGVNCSSKCSRKCKADTCDYTNGKCDCNENYRGDTCFVCPEGKYGKDCSQMCSPFCSPRDCNNVTGLCDECTDGYSGDDCTTCPPSKHGTNCTNDCSKNCFQHLCDPVRGTCDNCADGFGGDNCAEKLTSESQLMTISATVFICVIMASAVILAGYYVVKDKLHPSSTHEHKHKERDRDEDERDEDRDEEEEEDDDDDDDDEDDDEESDKEE